jgi:hypothetical protein
VRKRGQYYNLSAAKVQARMFQKRELFCNFITVVFDFLLFLQACSLYNTP